jgi:hypothetical protein
MRKFENRVPRGLFGPKSEEGIRGWRKLHKDFHNLYPPQDIIRVFTSSRSRCKEHIARIGEMRSAYTRGPLEKFVDSPYYSESEICGGAVTVSFSKYFPWHGARSGLYDGYSNGLSPIHFFQAEKRIQFKSRPMQFLGFSKHENGAPRQEISK